METPQKKISIAPPAPEVKKINIAKQHQFANRWNLFRNTVMNSSIKEDSIQYREMKLAFYAGMIDGESEMVYATSPELMEAIYTLNLQEFQDWSAEYAEARKAKESKQP